LTVTVCAPTVGPARVNGAENASEPVTVLQVTLEFATLMGGGAAAPAGAAIAAKLATMPTDASPASTRVRIFTVSFSSVDECRVDRDTRR
jgi:hypothetical protein